ncbi:MAG: DUF4835 family protein [Bacteroidales bacterium]|nr:DUF4835 family protein [Bacteroidales bacterium]MBN2817368.1 DUF4835 family protein [Bacteroidales bacterium]
MLSKVLFGFALLIYSFFSLSAQELNCNFTINTSKIQGTNKQVFTAMEEAIRDFLNNTVFTNHVYEANERIECNVLLDISDQPTANEFSGRLQIQSRRPVFGSSYNSVLFNYIDDDVEFTYQEGDPIEFSENTFVSNLSSLLSYYAYVIIGLDYDSFSNKGGTPFYTIAEKIVNNARTTNYSGWNSGDDKERKNRYWLIDNLLDSDYEPLREFYYKYHRLGLDVMENSVEQGKAEILRTVEILERFNNNRPDPFTFLLTVVMDSKATEMVSVFSESPEAQKAKVYKILTTIDPAGGTKYNPLKN